MNLLITPKPSNWLLVPGVIAIPLMLATAVWSACSGSQPQATINDPTTLCANGLAMSQTVRAQAAKLAVEPGELAQQVCASALLGARLIEANLKEATGSAGAPSARQELWPNVAGAAGSGG